MSTPTDKSKANAKADKKARRQAKVDASGGVNPDASSPASGPAVTSSTPEAKHAAARQGKPADRKNQPQTPSGATSPESATSPREDQKPAGSRARADSVHDAKQQKEPKQKQNQSNQPNPTTQHPAGARPRTRHDQQSNTANLFAHLAVQESAPVSTSTAINQYDHLHPAIVKLGLMLKRGEIMGSDARCEAMMLAFCEFIESYTTPPETALRKDLDTKLKEHIQFLVECRKHSNGMGNAIRHVKALIAAITPEVQEAEAKARLCQEIRDFVESRITSAKTLISRYCISCIRDGDVIMTFAHSTVVRDILLFAHSEGIRFRAVVCDGRPLLEGRKMLKALADAGISCTYARLSAAGVVMKEVTKVILGASSLLSNGAVLARAGTAMVAALAKYRRVPVIVAAETYKFTGKVQLDSIVNNELADPAELIKPHSVPSFGGAPFKLTSPLQDNSEAREQAAAQKYSMINLRYDLTPISCVSLVATETGLIPPTSIPVLIRELSLAQSQGVTAADAEVF